MKLIFITYQLFNFEMQFSLKINRICGRMIEPFLISESLYMMKNTKKLFLSIILCVSAGTAGYYVYNSTTNYNHAKTVFGNYEYDKEILEVINSPVMQRLKNVDQSGPARYFGPVFPAFSRYDHSVGVWAILKKAGCSIKEQIAGLIHDSSHTVFSHVGDYIFAKNINDYVQDSYQDSIHLKSLQKTKVKAILEKAGFLAEDFDPEKNEYLCLEQPLPDMCADRIQYNIYTGELLGIISSDDAKAIADNIKFEKGKWFFSDKKLAKKFADLSLYFTQNFWGSKWNTSMNIHLANALKRALDLKLITVKELFSTDDIVMNKLVKNQDHLIQLNLQQCKMPLEKIPGKKYKTESFKPKFRGIDPLIKKENGKFVRLTKLDHMFKNHYEAVKKWCNDGFDLDILTDY